MLKAKSLSLDEFEVWRLGYYRSPVALTHLHIRLLILESEDEAGKIQSCPTFWFLIPGLDYSSSDWKDPSSHSEYAFRAAGRAAASQKIRQLSL